MGMEKQRKEQEGEEEKGIKDREGKWGRKRGRKKGGRKPERVGNSSPILILDLEGWKDASGDDSSFVM